MRKKVEGMYKSGGAKLCELMSVMDNLTAHLRRILKRLRLV